jgi:hypothetical protein
VLSWPVLEDGPQGVDYLWHWHLASWVSTEFPWLPYWNRWDLSGVPYRNLYPILPHWFAVAISRVFGLDLFGAMQVIQFAVTPLMALGLYAFCDWRLRRPLVGIAAALLFLLDPLSWVESVDYMWFASQLGVIFFMPAVLALDWYFEQWSVGARGWRHRLAAVLFVFLSAAVGSVSPAALSAPVLVLVAYVLVAGRRSWWRWLIGPVPLMTAAIVALQLFWMGPFAGFLSFVGSRAPALVFNPALVTTFDPRKLLELVPIDATVDVARFSVSPAVWVPAIAGLAYAVRDPRARAWAALALLGLVLLTVGSLYYPLGVVPGAGVFVEALYRPAAIQVRFFVPLLGAVGLFALTDAVAGWLSEQSTRWIRIRIPAQAVAVVVASVLLLGDVVSFAGHIEGFPYSLAYGPGFEGTYSAHGPDVRDLWLAHTDSCRDPKPRYQACSSIALTYAFSVTELAAACKGGDGSLRSGVPICVALGPDLAQPRWDPANDALIGAADAWCTGRSDPVCSARYDPTWRQILDPRLWRPLEIGCYLASCQAEAAVREALGGVFPRPPQRLAVQGEVQRLASAAHELTGGAGAGTIAVGGGGAEPSRELYQFVENSMLKKRGVTAKQELSAITGIDSVALGPTQLAQGDDYVAMGWRQTSSQPVAYQDPSPAGLASEWPAGNAVLVVGASQTSAADVYNTVFERSVSGGLVPFSRGWLVRGQSPFVDDYSAAQLAGYGTILMWGYRYHSHDAAWALLDQWVRAGGRLFVETGWQYVNPDWNGGPAPSVLPMSAASWGPLDASAPVMLGSGPSAVTAPDFGDLHYQGGAWGASSASGSALRSGAEPVVTIGGRLVVARQTLGSGEVLWSGMNLIAHAVRSGSPSEDALVRDQFDWLLPQGGASSTGASPALAASLPQDWTGNETVSLPLQPSSGPALVLLKESLFPGWSAELVGADGSRRPVDIVDSEYDYMLVRLDAVPAGARLEFTYRPPWTEVAYWIASALSLLVILVWLVRPRAPLAALAPFGVALRAGWRPIGRRLASRWHEDEP